MVMPIGDLDDAALLGQGGASADGQAQPEDEAEGSSGGAAAATAPSRPATAAPALTLDDVNMLLERQGAAIRSELAGVRQHVDKSFQGVQSLTDKRLAQLQQNAARQQELIEAIARQNLDPDVLEGMTKRQAEAALADEKRQIAEQWEYIQQQRAALESQPPPQAPAVDVFTKHILPDLMDVAGEEGVELQALSDAGLLPKSLAPYQTAKDPEGWQGYKKAVVAAIKAEGERQRKAAQPKPKVPVARPAGGTVTPAGGRSSYNYFMADAEERQRTGR